MTGPIDRVPCPHCGETGDYRAIRDTMRTFESGSYVSCDRCLRVMKVVAVQQVTVVKVMQAPGRRGDGHLGGKPMADGGQRGPAPRPQQRPPTLGQMIRRR
jgi:hypothetical protein